jgi:hypothetical protein
MENWRLVLVSPVVRCEEGEVRGVCPDFFIGSDAAVGIVSSRCRWSSREGRGLECENGKVTGVRCHGHTFRVPIITIPGSV